MVSYQTQYGDLDNKKSKSFFWLLINSMCGLFVSIEQNSSIADFFWQEIGLINFKKF